MGGLRAQSLVPHDIATGQVGTIYLQPLPL
jgi:hypothetical protein